MHVHTCNKARLREVRDRNECARDVTNHIKIVDQEVNIGLQSLQVPFQ